MHPILARPWRLGLYLLLFLQAGALAVEVQRSALGGPRRELLLLILPLFLVHAFSCLASWYVCRALPLGKTRPERLLTAQVGTALLTSGAIALLGLGWARILGDEVRLRSSLASIFAFAFFLYSICAALHYLFLAQAASREAEARAYELRLLAREAELQALRAQIDPHFLFNSLHSINALVGRSPQEARQMCVRLADFLRRTVQVGEERSIALEQELQLVQDYLAVEKVRFGDRLEIRIDAAEAVLGRPVPPLILQPLVENAVRHGVAHLLDGGRVEVLADLDTADRLRLRVVNPCDPDRPRGSGTGVGLENVRRRVETAWGARAEVAVREREERFAVEVTLPPEPAAGRSEASA